MGKRNRARTKRSKDQQAKSAADIKLISFSVESLSAKEDFLLEIKSIFSRCLKDFKDLTDTRIVSSSSVQVKQIKPDRFALPLNKCSIQDPSNEYFHIFSIQLQKFVVFLKQTTKEVYNSYPKIFKACFEDSCKTIELIGKYVNTLTENFCNAAGIDFEHIAIAKWKEQIDSDIVLNKYFLGLKEEADKGGKKAKKKKNNKDETRDVEMDQEIEEFRSKLELHAGEFNKFKPDFTEDWVNGLRKRLKERISGKAF